MAFPLAGMVGGSLMSRLGFSAFGSRFTTSPLIQGGTFGVGYTGGSYLGYGASNTWDPFSIHNKSSYSRPSTIQFRMPYGRRYYGRRSYYSRYGRRYRRRRSYRTRYYRRYY